MNSSLISPATTTEGFGYGNLTFRKKVTIVDETDYIAEKSSNGGAYSYTKELYYFHGTHPDKGVFGYWRIAYESNCSEFTTDSNGVFCDYVIYLDFGKVGKVMEFELPLFKEQCSGNDERGEVIAANLWEYLSPVTDEEFFFAKDAIVCRTINGEEMVSWRFGRFDGYHQ